MRYIEKLGVGIKNKWKNEEALKKIINSLHSFSKHYHLFTEAMKRIFALMEGEKGRTRQYNYIIISKK